MTEHVTSADHMFSSVKDGERWVAYCRCGWDEDPRPDVYAALRDRYDHLIASGTHEPLGADASRLA